MTSASGRPRSALTIATAARMPAADAPTRSATAATGSTSSPAASRRRRCPKAESTIAAMHAAATSQPTTSEKNVPARLVMPGSVMLIVPSLPSTASSAPCHPSSPARVTTNEGIPSRVDKVPCSRPIVAPTARPARIAGHAPQPDLTERVAVTAAARPLTAPTERSISPSSSTSTTPTEIVPTAAIWRARLVRLTAVRKRSLAIVKIVQMTTSTSTTRSEPRSPSTSRRAASRRLTRSAARPAPGPAGVTSPGSGVACPGAVALTGSPPRSGWDCRRRGRR